MDNKELEKLLLSVPAPEPSAEYEADFPDAVVRALARPASVPETKPVALPSLHRLGWAFLFAVIIGGGGAWLGFRAGHKTGFGAGEIAGYQRIWTEVNTLFPHQVRAVVLEPGGPRIVLSDHADLPAAPPIVVRRCLPGGCQTAITFSGQQVRLGEEPLEILNDGAGNVIVTTPDAVWPVMPGTLKIQARTLDTLL